MCYSRGLLIQSRRRTAGGFAACLRISTLHRLSSFNFFSEVKKRARGNLPLSAVPLRSLRPSRLLYSPALDLGDAVLHRVGVERPHVGVHLREVLPQRPLRVRPRHRAEPQRGLRAQRIGELK